MELQSTILLCIKVTRSLGHYCYTSREYVSIKCLHWKECIWRRSHGTSLYGSTDKIAYRGHWDLSAPVGSSTIKWKFSTQMSGTEIIEFYKHKYVSWKHATFCIMLQEMQYLSWCIVFSWRQRLNDNWLKSHLIQADSTLHTLCRCDLGPSIFCIDIRNTIYC